MLIHINLVLLIHLIFKIFIHLHKMLHLGLLFLFPLLFDVFSLMKPKEILQVVLVLNLLTFFFSFLLVIEFEQGVVEQTTHLRYNFIFIFTSLDRKEWTGALRIRRVLSIAICKGFVVGLGKVTNGPYSFVLFISHLYHF